MGSQQLWLLMPVKLGAVTLGGEAGGVLPGNL
jgi:hypothetical protein